MSARARQKLEARMRIAAVVVTMALAAGALGAQGAAATPGETVAPDAQRAATAAASVHRCKGALKRGKHRFDVYRRKISCRRAKRLTRRTLRRKRAPRRWRCNLSLPRSGFCANGKRQFAFVRRG